MSMIDVGPSLVAVLVLGLVAAVVQYRKKASEKVQEAPGESRKLGNGGAAVKAAVPEAAKEEEEEEKVVVQCMFGSQTGTAEGFAKDIAKDLNKQGFKAKVVDLEDVDPTDFLEEDAPQYHVYFMATYGEGDPPDNAKEFMAGLLKDEDEGGLPAGSARNLKFAVFALGNTQYDHYNKTGKAVHDRLLMLGATAVRDVGMGDDDDDIEEDFSSWREGFAEEFAAAAFGPGKAAQPSPEDDVQGTEEYDYRAIFVPTPEDAEISRTEGRIEASKVVDSHHAADLSSRHYFQGVQAVVSERQELRQNPLEAGGAGNTVHVEFDLQGTGIQYQTAGNLTVCAENNPSQVESTARFLGLDLNQWVVLEPVHPESSKQLFPTPCTIRAALSYFTDLNGLPTRGLLGKLAEFVTIPEHKERLLHYSTQEGKGDYLRFIANRHQSIAEVIETFPSFKLDEKNLGGFFDAMPRLKGREFTIASSALSSPDRLALTVGVIREEKPGEPHGRLLEGVCSNFLASLQPGNRAFVFAKESTFRLPTDPTVPVLMIGPGTGIAPMRAFIQERTYLRKQLNKETGDAVLFFGCRREDEDFLYSDELHEAVSSGVLTGLHTAFSRQEKEKVYVQHLIKEQGEQVWDLISRGAYIYVCGATRMGKDVHLALENVCYKVGGVTEPKAFVEELQTSGRYIQELWS
mmetsp:Transcript_13400/g.24814  ORF Transcript_13400/g.24814 Transcript_13400/m.24814 type:complete len:687 (+) Transcript_13400:177-2237(+)